MQAVQFQSGNQYGARWHWGSKYNESGELLNATASNHTEGRDVFSSSGFYVEVNSMSAMPRSAYTNKPFTGQHYTYFAATAESEMTDVPSTAADSLCPKDWQLPSNGSTNKSYTHLLFDNYKDINGNPMASNAASSVATRQYPLSFAENGFYGAASGITVMNFTRYFSSYKTGFSGLYYLNIQSDTVAPWTYNNIGNGYGVRCVRRS